MTFCAHKLLRSGPFLDTQCEIWQLMWKTFYIGDETGDIYVPGTKQLRWFFLKSFSYLYEVVRTNFSVDFWTFHNFLTAVSWTSCHHLATKMRTYSAPERATLSERVKTPLKLTHKPWHNTRSNYAPLERTARWPRSVTNKKVIEDVTTSEKDGNHFSSQRKVFPTGCTEKFGVNDWRAVSQQ